MFITMTPRLGEHLYEHPNRRVPVIGVAKTRFHDAAAVEVMRGASRSPLYVTAAGMDATTAAGHIQSMHGRYRLPDLLKWVDRLAKGK